MAWPITQGSNTNLFLFRFTAGDLPVLPDQIHAPDLQQEVHIPVVGGRPGMAPSSVLHDLHSCLEHLQALDSQGAPQRGRRKAVGDGNLAGRQVGCFRPKLRCKIITQPGVGTRDTEEEYLGVLQRDAG